MMGMDRITVFKSMAEQDPTNILARYGLAMEHVKLGAFEDAVKWFQAVLEINPNYGAAYFHGGQTYEKMGDIDAAKAIYQKGIEVTARTGDGHTRAELQGALDLLP
jgi:tetratricopeptide (TPR) repeat protein